MPESWIHETERYRYATREDISAFTELLADPEASRWLWYTPVPLDRVGEYVGRHLDRQAEAGAAGEAPQRVVFAVEDLSGVFLGRGSVVAVEASPRGWEIGFQLLPTAWGRGVGTRLGQFLCAGSTRRRFGRWQRPPGWSASRRPAWSSPTADTPSLRPTSVTR